VTNVIKHCWFDLEDTIITPVLSGWQNCEAINVDKMRRFIADNKFDRINLFSFAIDDDDDLAKFNQITKPHLEATFGFKLSATPTMQDIASTCCAEMNLKNTNVNEVRDFWSKHQSFRLYCKRWFSRSFRHGHDVHVTLVDDMVFRESFSWPTMRIQGEIYNIEDI
jgi:hypothetical protein